MHGHSQKGTQEIGNTTFPVEGKYEGLSKRQVYFPFHTLLYCLNFKRGLGIFILKQTNNNNKTTIKIYLNHISFSNNKLYFLLSSYPTNRNVLNN